MEIKGVIFDMDGLMIDTEKHYNQFLCRAANELGFPMKREHALMLRSLDKRLAGPLMQKYLGAAYDHQRVKERYNKYVDEYFATHEIEVKPGLFQLLEYLREQHYITCVATATARNRALTFLKKIGAAQYFTYLCSGHELENSKPAPDIYLKTAKEMGLKPSDCIALEDSPNGVRAASSAGCCTIMVPDLTQPDEEIRNLIFAKADTLTEVIGIIEENRAAE